MKPNQSQQHRQPHLRLATNDDCDKLAALVSSVLTEYGLPLDPEGIDADIRDIQANYFDKGGVFYCLADRDGSIVGACALFPISKESCELRKMYLAKSHRRRGLGKLLLDTAIAKARKMKFRQITLETATVLTEAIALYKSYGFKPCQPDHLCFRCDQAYRLNIE